MRMIPNGEMVGGGARKEIKLLVVDDHSDHFEHIQAFADMYSSQFAFECKLAKDEKEAQELADSWEPSVAFHLVTSGLELIQSLTHKGAAVVAVSEVRIPQLAETAQAYGAVGCFTKSDNPDDIETLMSYMASVASSSVVSH